MKACRILPRCALLRSTTGCLRIWSIIPLVERRIVPLHTLGCRFFSSLDSVQFKNAALTTFPSQTTLRLISNKAGSSFEDLLEWLDGDTATHSTTKNRSAKSIKDNYRLQRREHIASSECGWITASSFTSLIRLFGSLSVFPSKDSALASSHVHDDENIFGFHRKLSSMDHKSFTMHYWPFVVELAHNKVQFGFQLSKEDQYWLMFAALEDGKRAKEGPVNFDTVAYHVSRARNYYFLCHRSKADWTLHHRFLESLYQIDETFSDEVVYRIGNLLAWHGYLSLRLINLLRRILLLHGDTIGTKARSRLIAALRANSRKSSATIDHNLPSKAINSSSPLPLSSCPVFTGGFDAQAIRDFLSHHLFSTNKHSSPRNDLQDCEEWASWEVQSALFAFNHQNSVTKEEEAIVWSNLRLLAMSYGLPEQAEDVDFINMSGLELRRASSASWTVINALSAVERSILRRPSDNAALPLSNRAAPDALKDVVRALWMLWRKHHASTRGVALPPLVTGAVAISFMRLAGFSRDVPLKEALARHLASAVVYPALHSNHPMLTMDALLALAVEYAAMCSIVHELNSWDEILVKIDEAQLYPTMADGFTWRAAVVNGVLVALLQYDVSISYALYRAVSRSGLGVELEDATVQKVGKALASSGFVELAFVCMDDDRLSISGQGYLLAAILKHIIRFRQQSRLDPQLVRLIATALTRQSTHSTDLHAVAPSVVQNLVQQLARSGFLDDSVAIVQAIQSNHPTYLGTQFLHDFLSEIVQQRRHRTLARAITPVPGSGRPVIPLPNHPRYSYLKRLLERGERITVRKVSKSVPFSFHEWPVLRQYLRFNSRLAERDRKVLSLQLSKLVLHPSRKSDSMPTVDAKALERIIYTLIRVGRISSAMKVVDRVLGYASPSTVTATSIGPQPMPTKVGNIIISGSLQPRKNRRSVRQVRHATSRMTFLVEKRGFVPDRVTLNIVMKALLRWESVSSADTLRSLFDKLVAGGYPSFSPTSENFGTGSSVVSGVDDSSGQISTSKSDERHSSDLMDRLHEFPGALNFRRHTRPLYRMFVKAFRSRGDPIAAEKVKDILRFLQANDESDRARRLWYKERRRRRGDQGAAAGASSK